MNQDENQIVVSKEESPTAPLLSTDYIEVSDKRERAIVDILTKGKKDKYGRFVIAALSSIPWVGFLGAIANLKAEADQDGVNSFLMLWVQEHELKINELTFTINDILNKLDSFGPDVRARIESPQYLALVRQTFRSWDQSDTTTKRLMFKKLITNAGAITLCPDDQIRLFISWIERYHEAHFAVIKEIYQNKKITKGRIWDNIHSEGRPRDDSAEAGLFGYLMRELNMGGIIHLERSVNSQGQGMRAPRSAPSAQKGNDTVESPFEDIKLWELSELGKEFVRYVMEDIDKQIGDGR